MMAGPNHVPHKALVGAILRTIDTSLTTELREHPDDPALGELLFQIENTLRSTLHMPERKRDNALVASGHRALSHVRQVQYQRGNPVMARWEEDGRWYRAVITHRRPYGYRVEWEDGSRSNVATADVRPRRTT